METKEYKLYNIISRIFDPIILSLPWFCFLMLQEKVETIHLIIILQVLIVIPLLFFFIQFLRKKHDFDLSDRKKRIPLFILINATNLTTLYLVHYWGYNILFKYISCMVLITLIFLAITLYWKISAHALVNSVLIILLIKFASPWFSLLFITLLPLIFIARIKLKKHDIYQLIGGTLLSFVIIFYL